MRWVAKDLEMYLNAKEYVDTAVIPLLPVSFGDDIKNSASMTEFITLISPQIERQFKGRLIMFPGFSYIKNSPEEKLVQDLNSWVQEFQKNDFKHIFFVTSDSDWKVRESALEGTLIWLPFVPLEHMDENSRSSFLEEQVKQLMNLFINKWQDNEIK